MHVQIILHLALSCSAGLFRIAFCFNFSKNVMMHPIWFARVCHSHHSQIFLSIKNNDCKFVVSKHASSISSDAFVIIGVESFDLSLILRKNGLLTNSIGICLLCVGPDVQED